MHVVITGSRGWVDLDCIRAAADALPERSTVIVGGARGADEAFEGAARLRGHTVIVDRAIWTPTADTPPERIKQRRDGQPYDSFAGFARNLKMLDRLAHLPDTDRRVIAFWLGTSPGTRHTIVEAMKRGIPLDLHWRPE